MRIQALILSLIILVSLLISGNSFLIKSSELKPSTKNIEPKINTGSIFLKDLRLALSERAVSISQSTSKRIVLINQSISKKITFWINTINQNLSTVKQVLSDKRDSFLLALTSKNNTNNNLELNNLEPENRDFSVAMAETANSLSLDCNFNQFSFNSKALLAKYLAYNIDIFKLNPEKRWPIASLTKLMTSLIAIEKIGVDKEVTISEKAVSTEGTAGEFQVGEVFKVSDLIKAMLVTSSNDAAVAITEILGEKEFINEMQRKASELKMSQTTFLEPTGLSFINQSTITDLAKLMNYIYLNHPELLEISRQKETIITDLKTGKPRKLFNVNHFAGQPDFIGGKTGYIEEAGRNLIALFNIDGKVVLTITLGADDSFKETEKLKSLIQNCK